MSTKKPNAPTITGSEKMLYCFDCNRWQLKWEDIENEDIFFDAGFCNSI